MANNEFAAPSTASFGESSEDRRDEGVAEETRTVTVVQERRTITVTPVLMTGNAASITTRPSLAGAIENATSDTSAVCEPIPLPLLASGPQSDLQDEDWKSAKSHTLAENSPGSMVETWRPTVPQNAGTSASASSANDANKSAEQMMDALLQEAGKAPASTPRAIPDERKASPAAATPSDRGRERSRSRENKELEAEKQNTGLYSLYTPCQRERERCHTRRRPRELHLRSRGIMWEPPGRPV